MGLEMVDKTIDQQIPAALEELAEQILALDVTALAGLQGGQVLGGVAGQWVRQIVTLQERIVIEADDARRVAVQLASEG